MQASIQGTPPLITLVDDVVTKGATLLAAAQVVEAALPGAQLRAFALIRTCGFVADVAQIEDPTIGMIQERSRDARRDP
jgi:hypothetical protein